MHIHTWTSHTVQQSARICMIMACLHKPCTSLFPEYPMCGHNRRANGSWARLESHRSNVCTTQNASHGELDTKHRWTYSPASNPFRTCQLHIRVSVTCVPGLDFCSSMAVGCTTDLRQDRFAQPTHPASPSAYSVFPTPNIPPLQTAMH